MIRRLSALVALASSLACAQVRSPAVGEIPTLVVFLTIDQMRADYLQRFDTQLTGGLRRMYDSGAVFLEGYHDQGITETAPGHASTMSGRFPVHTGIVMNSQGVNGVPNAAVIGGTDGVDLPASPVRFRGTTLTDWLRAANPSTRFLSVSRKDRGAILPIGLSKGDVYWWTLRNGMFSTSRYYADSLPAWVRAFNDRGSAQKLAGTSWDLLLPTGAYPEPDTVDVENGGNYAVFPHLMSTDTSVAKRTMAAFPWMDELTLQFALAGIQELGLGTAPDRTDLLAVSLSSTDAIGHAYGPDSRELHDQILRLDRSLGLFFDSLFTLRDRRRIVVALTGDHGMAPYPMLKSTLYPNHSARVVSVRAKFSAFRARLAAAGVDSTAVTMEEAAVVLAKPAAFAGKKMNADSAIAAFGEDAKRVDGVLRADLLSALARADTVHDSIARRWLHMFSPDGPARMVITLTPYSYWASSAGIATHGSPHDYDAHVPIIFYGAGFVTGRFSNFVRVVDMAPTLAALVGVTPLEPLDGHVLREAIRP